ncbi:thiamine phosphate synthase [Tepidamorphus sp. 3E244]|uniref:thiamine phosphate synthase n=1 Tax=Tepidamorphus sp. 3E244 TaxID=3385498 RepID=UPI0038FD0726
MTSQQPTDSEPRIVLFAPIASLRAVEGEWSSLAAIVVTDPENEIPEDLRAAIRAAGTPLLKATVQAERAAGFDGLHLVSQPGELRIARKELPAGGMLGAGAARTRHAAMELGEAMPDYVLLGRIAGTDADDRDIAVDDDLVIWWSTLFELPCVAVAEDEDSARRLALAGADFIGLNRHVWKADDPASALRKIAGIIAEASPREDAEAAG